MRLPQIEPLQKFADPGLNKEFRNIYNLISRLFARGYHYGAAAPENPQSGGLWYDGADVKIYCEGAWVTLT